MKDTKYAGPWVEDRPKEELSAQYEGWEEEAHHLVKVSTETTLDAQR